MKRHKKLSKWLAALLTIAVLWTMPSGLLKVQAVGVNSPQNVTAIAGNGSVKLNWNAVSGATQYAIAYQSGDSWTTLTLSCTSTTYTATNLVSGKTYTFLVQAMVNGNWSKFDSTDYVIATPTGATKPTAKAIAVGNESVTLNWNAISGATKYAIAYQDGDSWDNLSLDCTGTTYTATGLTNHKQYTFLVQSYADGKWSSFNSSDYVLATPCDASRPFATAAAGDGSATLNWSAVAGATQYAVAYQNGDSWTTLTLNCTSTTYTATNLVPSKTYIFLVQAMINGNWSKFDSSDYVTATPTGATKPTAKVTAVGNGSVTLNWNAISGATKYAIAYQDGDSWDNLSLDCTGTTYTATGLTNHKPYTFLIQSYADGKWSSFNSSDYIVGTPYDASRPFATATTGDGSATLNWSAVAGATQYAVAYQNGDGWTTLTLNCTSTTYTATNLVSGKTYTFLVQAMINDNWSAFDNSDYVIATPTGATKPTAKVTAVGNESVTLNWNAISGATKYAIAYQDGDSWDNLSLDCTGTTYTATGLTNHKPYTFLVQSYADGKWSSFNSSDYVVGTPYDASRPFATATIGDGSATLNWSAVAGATQYAVAYQNGDGWTTLTLNCTSTNYTATNLVSGKTYTFLVQAMINGNWSKFDSSDYVTATPTGATKPTAKVTAVGNGSVTLNWNSISGATKYAIAYKNGDDWVNLSLDYTGTSYTATGLQNHTIYSFLVQSYADGKWSSYNSADFVDGTPYDVSRPYASATVGNGTVALKWNAVSGATKYAIAYQDGDSWDNLSLDCTGTTYTATGLTNHKEYTFLVQAYTNGKWTNYDHTDYIICTPYDPARPFAEAVAGDGCVTLNWNAISGATKYAIAYQDGDSWDNLSLDCTGTTYTAKDLVSGKTYTFLVQAMVDGKWSPFDSTDYVTAIPTGATKPTVTVTSVDEGSVTLSWNVVSGATQYAIAYKDGNNWVTLTLNCTGTTYTATGLSYLKEYVFLVQSYADDTWSSYNDSDGVSARPLPVPGTMLNTMNEPANFVPYSKTYTDSNGVYHSSNCTWWAAARFKEVNGYYSITGSIYSFNSSTCSYQISSFSIGVYPDHHVVFIEAYANGYVYFSEANYNSNTNFIIQKMSYSDFINKRHIQFYRYA